MQRSNEVFKGTTLIIRGVLQMFPELETGDEFEWGDPLAPFQGRALTGAEAVRAVMVSEPMQWMTVRAVLQRLEEQGWLPQSDNPPNAIRAALERALAQGDGIEKGKSEKAGAVVYRYNPSLQEEPF